MKKILALGIAFVLLMSHGVCLAQDESNDAASHILIAYFSLWGNVDYAENVDATTSASIVLTQNERVGTTEIIAEQILNTMGGDKFLIQTVEPYPTDFQDVIDLNHEEAAQNILPGLTGSIANMAQYDTVFLGYPVWNMTIPQAIQTFLSAYEKKKKTIVPFCTHDGYGSGRSYSAIADICPDSTVLAGIAIESTEILGSEAMVADWLNQLDIPARAANVEIPILVSMNGITLEAVLYDTPEAQQFMTMLPLTVSMWNYGGREFYGGLSEDITPASQGQLYFSDGDITYCDLNNTVAIFYAQTNRPNLTMEVIPMGRITSDLEAFIQMESDADITFSPIDKE